ncbi:GIY-YIG nuclease family protein [Teichococcus vastitatis]|uniref:GIY-YIG domain-containing protein n=1 Tax=Teichococcus vastitatis TaxID=2307076 RepID=A0ABS9W8V0_9PROT|nr:hypothetical protein [Pseudoroseomonas vastitatis]MCI0755657.1 hypothetical protein [Pseudoroseomonas vastitatis]
MPASHPPPADLSSRAALAPAPAPRVWRIYRITRCRDGRGYVGVTCRSLAGRAAAHRHHARRHPDLGRPGSLAAAIRAALAEGLGFAEAFRIEELDSTPDPAAARALERHWIARLGTAWPEGFNRAPGGASLGGPANAVPVTLHHPRRGVRRYPSLLAAIAAIEAERRAAGRPPLPPGVVYARRALGWSPEEALGLRPHRDGRGLRSDVCWAGQPAASLRAVAAAQNIPLATLRSRLHRARKGAGADGANEVPDLARDRRKAGKATRSPPLALPHPTDPCAAPVTAAVFARLTELPRATVLHRYHALVTRRGMDAPSLSRARLLRGLRQRRRREIPLRLVLPDGRVLRGGVRGLIRRVLNDAALAGGRPERLGCSAIRARLRRLPDWPRPDGAGIAWAFGFRPAGNRP